MNEKREVREVHYSIARRLLERMLENGFITEEEYDKIDGLNRETFSPEMAKVYA
ncbi:SHOCT domain-containing protein [Hungatella effluvii]|uniref:SHOCT domain-containing protein n=1 Tax=Hungatella effluvii TaxID=1096246 RepID=UPI0022E362E9|nr:SHOCT domain-containing protein [Hungatella effluvii]